MTVLKYRKSAATVEITLAESVDGAWEEALAIQAGGTKYYAQCDSNLSHANATDLRVRIGGTTYTVLSEPDSGDSGSFYPAASGDDGHCVGGLLDKTWNGLAFGNYDSGSYENYVLFKNVTIPQGSTIDKAIVKFTAYSDYSGTTVDLDLEFGDIDDASEPSNCTDVANTARTATIDWDNVGSWSDGVEYDSPELKTILQTVINRVGWLSGNTLAFFIVDDSSSSFRGASAYDYDSGNEKMELYVEWS